MNARSDSALDFAAAQTTSASIDVLGSTVDQSLNPLDVGLPGSVGASVGMGDLDTKRDALSAKFTLCHDSAPPYDCDLCLDSNGRIR